MNISKRLTGFLVIVLGLLGAVSAFGAKPFNTNVHASKLRYIPHAVEMPRASPVISGLPCQKARHWPRVTTYTECNTSANHAAVPSLNAKAFLKTHAQALELRQDLADLKVAKVKESLNRAVTHFQQTFGNLTVLNSFVSIQQGVSGRVMKVSTSYINNPAVSGAVNPVISNDLAETNALKGISKLSGISSPVILGKIRSELSWSPIDDHTLRLVWVVKTRTLKPRGNFYTLVDANTGKILLQNNQIVFASTGTGMVYNPNPIQTSDILSFVDNNDENSPILEQQRVKVSLLGLAANTTLLKGDFVDVTTDPLACYLPQGQCANANNVNRDYDYTRDQPEFEQVVAYSTIDSVQRYLRDSLGFQDAQGNATIRNFPTMTLTHWSADDQSYYEPFADEDPSTFEFRGALNFGDGGVDDAEDSDIVVHEFGHAIQHNQNPGCFPGWDGYTPQVNEARAMGEGFGDYLAASFNEKLGKPAYQLIDSACVGEWDSTSYSKTIPTCLRRVDGLKQYPNDLVGEEHLDSSIWSAVLWDIHADRNPVNPNKGGLGTQRTDQLVIDSHFILDCFNGITMPQAAMAMIDSTTDVTEKDIMLTKFCNRGILVDSVCLPEVVKNIVVNVQKDSVLAMGRPNRNEGASQELRLRSVSEKGNKVMSIVLGFDLSKLKSAEVDTARLVMTVQKNSGGWGLKGRSVAVRPLKIANFVEGNGTLKNTGSGLGITWNCNVDRNISNTRKDCMKEWHGGDTNSRTAIPVVHTNSLKTGDLVTWDVSDDVKDGAMSWIVKKGNQNREDDEERHEKKGNSNRGEIVYFSKEGNPDLAPRLEITFK